MLRGYKKGEDAVLFFGQIENGELAFGVIEDTRGYMAGAFNKGDLVPNPERNTVIKAFQKAAAVAKEFSQRLRQKGNKASADFYLKKAVELEQQMD